MRRWTIVAFICLSGWAVAAFASFSLLKSLDARDDSIQDYRDFSQLYYFLWEYARSHGGKLPNTLEEGLQGTGAMEPYAGMFILLTPGATLSELPGNTPILKLKYPRKNISEVIMYPSGQVISKVNKNG
jgi:hypothetical protein